MLNTIELELREKSPRLLCQKNELFAAGVLHQLCHTEFCLFKPTLINKFSQIAFMFPLDTNEEFLNCILDCVEQLMGEPISLTKATEDSSGYFLRIKSEHLIGKVVQADPHNPWCLAGFIFVDFNKNIKENITNYNVITSELFKKNPFKYVSKFDYLLL